MSARNVELLPDKKIVRFSEILRFYTKDFLVEAPSLIAYANRYRLEKLPADWKSRMKASCETSRASSASRRIDHARR